LFAAGVTEAAQPLPPAEQVQAAKKLVAETFAKELSQADKTPAVMAMLELAEKTASDAPSQAALYLSAAEVAAHIGDTRLAFDAADKLARAFTVDVLATKGSLLDVAAEHAKTNDVRANVANRGLELAGAAISAGKFDLADAALKAAATASAKLRDADLRKEVVAKRRTVEKARKQAARIESELADARKKLDANPDDSAANESLGKHLAFDRNDWATGLKHLAKAKDSQLRAVAAADASAAGDSAQMAKTGDLWWSLAESADDAREKAGYQSRAVFWYTRAAVGLSGLAKARLEKRIAESGQAALASAADQTGGDSDKYLDITLAPGVLMRLVKIPASKDGRIKEFYLGQTEVTQRQWEAVMGGNPGEPKGESLPVNMMTYDDCKKFCLNSTNARYLLRLPTEDELRYACFCGLSPSEAYRGELAEYAWFKPSSGDRLHDVAAKKPNRFGLYDTLGNVWEWTSNETNLYGGSFDLEETVFHREPHIVTIEGKKLGRNTNFGLRVVAVGK
jgi:hypothetical protein